MSKISLYISWYAVPLVGDVTELFEFSTQGEVAAFFDGVEQGSGGSCYFDVFDEPRICVENNGERVWVPAI